MEAERALIRGKFNVDHGPFSVYVEGLAEGETLADRREERRLRGSSAILQEGYVEYKASSFFLKAGKQAMRWSDMWVTPSLDVWTARRWNRFLFDPQPEQLEHSTGVSASYAVEGFSADLFAVSELARSRFPEPLPEFATPESRSGNGGARVKWEAGGFGFSVLGARAGMKDIAGGAVNFATENFVPKLEIGRAWDRTPSLMPGSDGSFVAGGVDVFSGAWTFQPQLTVFDFSRAGGAQTIVYLSGTRSTEKHDLEIQSFVNTVTHDSFFNAYYGYNWKDWFQTGVFVQNYDGVDGGLFTLFKRLTGGPVYGVRLEFNAGFGT